MPNKLSVQELREALVSQAGYSGEELKDKKKDELLDLYEGVQNSKKVLDDVEEIGANKFEITPLTADTVAVPTPVDPEWSDYILGLLTEAEKESGHPKVHGLRRVAEKIYGPYSTQTHVVQAPGIEGRATVVVTVEFMYDGRKSDGAADVYSGNTDRRFAVHPVATAETRAEGRALSKVLKIAKVTAEEMQSGNGDESPDKMSPSMMNSLIIMCEKQGIDFNKLVDFKYKDKSLEQLTMLDGKQMSSLLFKFRSGDEEVPDEVKS